MLLMKLNLFQKLYAGLLRFQLSLLQNGELPRDYKSMVSVGMGVFEIRVRGDNSQARCFYAVKMKNCVFVLHSFTKKSQKTPKANLEIGINRYREMLIYLKKEK